MTLSPIVVLAVLAGCVHANEPARRPAARSTDQPRRLVTHLDSTGRTPVIDREALVIAGYFNPWGTQNGLFIAKLPNDRRLFDVDKAFHLAQDAKPPELERAVDAWLANGHWQPMMMATRIDPADSWERWSFPTLGITVVVWRDGFLQFYRDERAMGTSSNMTIGDAVGREVDHDQTVHVQELAYDPATHLVWVTYLLDNDANVYNDDEMVHVFYLSDITRFPSLIPTEGRFPLE